MVSLAEGTVYKKSHHSEFHISKYLKKVGMAEASFHRAFSKDTKDSRS